MRYGDLWNAKTKKIYENRVSVNMTNLNLDKSRSRDCLNETKALFIWQAKTGAANDKNLGDTSNSFEMNFRLHYHQFIIPNMLNG